LACVICEPVYYNAGCVLPTPEFRDALRRLTREHGVLLIFDEVLSAFRMAPGGAQEYLGVTPDLCTLGKAVGGGFPLSVFGGRRDAPARDDAALRGGGDPARRLLPRLRRGGLPPRLLRRHDHEGRGRGAESVRWRGPRSGGRGRMRPATPAGFGYNDLSAPRPN